jgi:hypothetical protein
MKKLPTDFRSGLSPVWLVVLSAEKISPSILSFNFVMSLAR